MELFEILKAGVEMGASDIHLTIGSPPLARVMGQIRELRGFEELTPETTQTLIYSILTEERQARFEARLELDCSINLTDMARFRVNVLRQQGAVEAVFRIIPAHIPSPEFLGLGPAIMGLADLPRGLVLVTGPTGCGKSTTLACMIEHINRTHNRHIITVEDPVEFVYSRKQSVIRQREVGADTHSFQDALRTAMRQDPDVILVGELRDLETVSLALTAAETGHLCLATLHTVDAAQTVDRIVDIFPPQQQQQVRVQLAGCLKGVVSQILLQRKDGAGQIAARELMVVNSAVSNMIREGKTHMLNGVIETGARHGMYSMDRSIEELTRRGLVGSRDALAKAHNPQRLAAAMETKGLEVVA